MSPCDDSKLSECSAEIAPFHLLQEEKNVTRKKCLVILCQIFKGEG